MTPEEKKAAFAAKQRARCAPNPNYQPPKKRRVSRRADAATYAARKAADHVDGYDRDDLGESYD